MTLKLRDKIPALVALTSLLTVSLLVVPLADSQPALATAAKTIYVGGTGASDARDGLTVETSKATIQAAINLAASGDTVEVAAGIYTESVVISKPLILLGAKSATSPASSGASGVPTGWGDEAGWTVVKAASGRVIQVTGAADGTVIKGFAITSTHGVNTPAANGPFGIDLLGPDDITVQNNFFYNLYNVAVTSTGAPASPRATRYLIDSNLITNAKGPFDSSGDYWASEIAGVNPWRIDDLTFSKNRIIGYGRGVQLEQNLGAIVRSNEISEIMFHGIQAANDQTDTLIEGNTVDRAQLGAYWEYTWGGGYCTGAIRLWTVDTSSGFVVRNNLVSNTGATSASTVVDLNDDYRDVCPAIALTGTNSAAVTSISNNSIANASNSPGSSNPGLGIVWTSNQITSASLISGVATLETFGSNSLAVGDTVSIASLGSPFNGSHVIASKSGTRTVTFTLSGTNVVLGEDGAGDNAASEATAIQPSAGATIIRTSPSTQVGAIAATTNWWGSATGPGTTGSTVNAAGAAVTTSPHIVSYEIDPAKAGQPGFWPIPVVPTGSGNGGPPATTPVPVVPAPAASPPASQSPEVTPAAVNAQIRGLPLPAAAIALLEGELAGVLIDGEPVEVRILTAEENIADAQALFGESSRLSLSPDSQLLNIANFDGTQSLEVNLADVKIIQIGSIRIALLSVGTGEGERGQNDDGKLVVQPDDQLVAVASGLPPLAVFRAFFFSTPTDLGTVVADGKGEVLLTALLPAETTPGDHTLQLTTSTSDGGLVQIAIPVVIAEPVVEMVESEPETVVAEPEAADGSPVTPLLWVLIGVLVLVAIVTTVILVARSRRA